MFFCFVRFNLPVFDCFAERAGRRRFRPRNAQRTSIGSLTEEGRRRRLGRLPVVVLLDRSSLLFLFAGTSFVSEEVRSDSERRRGRRASCF